MMCRYIGEEGEEVKFSYKELSEASQKAATVVESLGLQKAVCILPKVRGIIALNISLLQAPGAGMVVDQPGHHPGGGRPPAWHHTAHRQGHRGEASLLR